LVGVDADPVGVGDADVGCVVGLGLGESARRLGVRVPLDVTAGGSTREDVGLREPHAPRVISSATSRATGANRRRGDVHT
jgi:hypothetical protein